jgi:hypothetical protein
LIVTKTRNLADLGGGFIQAGTGAVQRTVESKLQDVVSVKDFGAVGDGVADDTAAFIAAHSAAPTGVPILVPSGTYYVPSNVTCTGRRFTFEGSSLTTNSGKLVGALIERTDPVTGGRQYGVGNSLQYGSYYRFGRNAGGPIGLTVGGGDTDDGDWGNVIFPDVYGGWTTIQPGKYLSSAELAIQPSSAAGAATLTNGGNTVTRVSGALFEASWVGKRIYVAEGRYKVATVNVGAETLTVTNLDGSAVTFPSGATTTFIVVGTLCQGIANVSGTAVTRVSGDPFVPLTNTEYILKVNGVERAVSSVTDFNTIVLSASAGTITNASYEIWTSVDDISSAMRIHRISGAGFEENLTLQASAAGYFHIYAAGGAGRQYPLFLGTGYNTSGLARRQVCLQSNGPVTIGGEASNCSLLVSDRDEVASDYFVISGADTGAATPAISMDGAAANINMGFSTKGDGAFLFSSNSFNGLQFVINPLNGATSRLAVTGSTGDQPKLVAEGTGANVDIWLQPKGTGRVLVGPYTASGAGTIVGHIEIKDSSGSVRKLAVIS